LLNSSDEKAIIEPIFLRFQSIEYFMIPVYFAKVSLSNANVQQFEIIL